MNTYLIPWNDPEECDILKISANDYKACQTKVMNYYVKKFDSDELADCTDYDEFLQLLWDNHDTYLGPIHEIEEYE